MKICFQISVTGAIAEYNYGKNKERSPLRGQHTAGLGGDILEAMEMEGNTAGAALSWGRSTQPLLSPLFNTEYIYRV
ncbi:MAG: hypothetical protein GDA43_14425 [Hormoscilla sp. SP5CHS1]|nr:hypothetical protein [Hormoscilla sp. SP5CHS1]